MIAACGLLRLRDYCCVLLLVVCWLAVVSCYVFVVCGSLFVAVVRDCVR